MKQCCLCSSADCREDKLCSIYDIVIHLYSIVKPLHFLFPSFLYLIAGLLYSSSFYLYMWFVWRQRYSLLYIIPQYCIKELICFCFVLIAMAVCRNSALCVAFASTTAKELSMEIILLAFDIMLYSWKKTQTDKEDTHTDPVFYQGSAETAVINDGT